MAFSIGDLVDLYDAGFKQWRGEYTVIKLPGENRPLYRIRNTKTNSQQWVREKHLRPNRLGQFRIRCLQP